MIYMSTVSTIVIWLELLGNRLFQGLDLHHRYCYDYLFIFFLFIASLILFFMGKTPDIIFTIYSMDGRKSKKFLPLHFCESMSELFCRRLLGNTHTCAYQGVRNNRFSENFACFVFSLPPFYFGFALSTFSFHTLHIGKIW